MTIEEQLKQEILSQYKSVRAFTNEVGIPYTTLDSVFKRGIQNAGVYTMIKVFSALNLDIESIPSGELRSNAPNEKTPSGAGDRAEGELGDDLRSILIRNFDQLNQEGQERLVETSDDMVSSGKYIKNDSHQLDSTQGA